MMNNRPTLHSTLLLLILLFSSCNEVMHIEFKNIKPKALFYINDASKQSQQIDISEDIITLPLKRKGHYDLRFVFDGFIFTFSSCYFDFTGSNHLEIISVNNNITFEHNIILTESEIERISNDISIKNRFFSDYGSDEFNSRFNDTHPKPPSILSESNLIDQSNQDVNDNFISIICNSFLNEYYFEETTEGEVDFKEELGINYELPFTRKEFRGQP